MKRSLLTGALVCVLAVLGVATPALSLRPYRPKPVEFSMAPSAGDLLGAASGHGHGPVSRPLRTPKRFNLVGLTWRTGPREPRIAIRARRDGGRWTRWTTVASHAEDGPDPGAEPAAPGVTNPTWVGEADWIQYRLTRRLGSLRLRFMNVRGTATRADRARTAIRRTVNAGFLSVSGAIRGGTARAAASKPEIVPRADWGASECQPRQQPELGEVKAAFVHHTVNANDYTRDEAPDVVLAICRFHRDTNGWNDIGYNFVVDRFGTIYEGRAGGTDQAVVGAQAQGYNTQSTGIANLGTFSGVEQTPEALRAMAGLIRWKLPLHGAPTDGTTTLVSAGGDTNRYPAGSRVSVKRVIGHRDTGATACPGDALYAQLPDLRRLVGGLEPDGAATRLRAKLGVKPGVVRYGGTAPVTGVLTGSAGPLARQPVEVQALIGSRWRAFARPSTAGDGTFVATVKPRRTRRLRVRFAGGSGLRSSTSPTFTVAVRPVVTVTERPARGVTGSPAVVRGRVSPAKGRIYQVLQVRRGGRFRKVGEKSLRVAGNGTFRGVFVPARSALYRFYLVAKADRSTARGASPRYRVRVSRGRGGAFAP